MENTALCVFLAKALAFLELTADSAFSQRREAGTETAGCGLPSPQLGEASAAVSSALQEAHGTQAAPHTALLGASFPSFNQESVQRHQVDLTQSSAAPPALAPRFLVKYRSVAIWKTPLIYYVSYVFI